MMKKKDTQEGLSIKMSSYQYRDSHYKEKDAYNGNLYTRKDGLNVETGPCSKLECIP